MSAEHRFAVDPGMSDFFPGVLDDDVWPVRGDHTSVEVVEDADGVLLLQPTSSTATTSVHDLESHVAEMMRCTRGHLRRGIDSLNSSAKVSGEGDGLWNGIRGDEFVIALDFFTKALTRRRNPYEPEDARQYISELMTLSKPNQGE